MINQNVKKYLFLTLILGGLFYSLFADVPKADDAVEQWDNSYCYLILPLVIYLCWEKRKAFRFDQFSWNLWGLIPVVIAVLILLVGELGSVETMLYVGLWVSMVGLLFIFLWPNDCDISGFLC